MGNFILQGEEIFKGGEGFVTGERKMPVKGHDINYETVEFYGLVGRRLGLRMVHHM